MTPEFIMARVEMLPDSPGCWLWTAAVQSANRKSAGGYGVFGAQGKTLFAHRVSYEVFRGAIPEGAVIDHLCRVRSCVNPAHLEAVTRRENILRGTGFSARHARKTHCRKGHPLDSVTTRANGQRQRYCGQCNRDNVNARRAQVSA